MSDDRPAVYVEDGRVIYRASALGGCLTALAAARQGFDPKPYPQRALEVFEAGQEAEDWFFAENPHDGQQAELELPVTGKIVIRAHADALEDTVGYEVKSQTGKDFDNWTPDWFVTDPVWQKYRWQISVMMLASGLPWYVIRVRRGEFPEFRSYFLEEPFFTLGEIRARVFEAEMLAREAELKCRVGDFFCPYPYLHDDEMEVVDDPELDEVAFNYLNAKTDYEARGKALAGLRERITGLMAGRGKVRLGSGRRITVSEVEVKEHVVKASTQTRLSVRGPK